MARTDKNPGVFASGAETTIPTTPIVGESYRNTGLSAAIADGWPFKAIVDSADFNEFMNRLTTFTGLIDKTGILEWKNDIDYDIVPAYTVGSDGNLYKSTAANGPATTVRDPVGDTSGTWVDQRSLGVGQTWQDVKTSRSLGVTYTNSTGKPIFVSVAVVDSRGNVPNFNAYTRVTLDGSIIIVDYASGQSAHSFIVPNGSTYRVEVNDTNDIIDKWAELR